MSLPAPPLRMSLFPAPLEDSFEEEEAEEEEEYEDVEKVRLLSAVYPVENVELEEDEDGIPIKYRDEIMAISKKVNKAVAKRWDEALTKRSKKQTV